VRNACEAVQSNLRARNIEKYELRELRLRRDLEAICGDCNWGSLCINSIDDRLILEKKDMIWAKSNISSDDATRVGMLKIAEQFATQGAGFLFPYLSEDL
jgi:hypothetical protein